MAVIARSRSWVQHNPATSLLVALALGAVIASSVAVYRAEKTRKIVTGWPCLKAPERRECAKVREKVARSEPVRNPCISFQRVEGRRGRNCPRLYVPPRRGEVVLRNPSQAGQPSEPPAGGGTGGPKDVTPGGTKLPPKSPE